ncbi:hypothetical protein N431DRAFT_418679 [Stipitochalara longipes BDJ]|nr:hypothetical protein N431DRAFT_418679 [Stipitochalara longipes BDJ]
MGTIYAERPYWTNTTTPVFSPSQWSEYPRSIGNGRWGRGLLDGNISHAFPSISIDTESLLLPPLQQHTPPPIDMHDDHLVNLFYTYFQPAHPILLPRRLYTSRNYPAYMRQVVHFIGSQYSTSVSSDSLATIAVAGLSHDGPKTPLLVQARLLYAIALHGRNDLDGFQSNLTQAITDALELEMNEEGFPAAYGRQNIFEEESMRRTWWELYVVEGYMAAFWHRPALSTIGVTMTVGLPCDEKLYNEGQPILNSPSLEQFSRRLFADDDIKYSSFCYRIEAVQILTRVLTLTGAKDIHRGRVQAVDNTLAGWIHHLPPEKTEVIAAGGEVDEILFQAQMILQCASIILHFPRSNLPHTSATAAEITGRQADAHISPTSTQHTHTTKAIDASKQISNLAALRTTIQTHTPFFSCGLVLGTVVQLSASILHGRVCVQQHHDRVALMIGILKSLSISWPYAEVVLPQLKKVAAEVFFSRSEHQENFSAVRVEGDNAELENSWLDTLDIQMLQNIMNFDMPAVGSTSG